MPGVEDDTWNGGFGAIQPGWQLYVGAVGRAAQHAHHAIQIVISDRPLVLSDGLGRRHRCTAAIIPADVPHAIAEGSSRAAMLFLEPESTAGRALAGRYRGDVTSVCAWIGLGSALGPGVLPASGDERPEAIVAGILRVLGAGGGEAPGERVHPALRDAIRFLPTILDGPVRVATVSAAVGLSASRLRHLFAEQLGLSFRRYVLWLRLQRAIEVVLGGASLTEAAHAAGFTDSAHLTNVTRRTFGLVPSQLARSVVRLPPSF